MPRFPTLLDNAISEQPEDIRVGHAFRHAHANDIAEALEAKIGIGASIPAAGQTLKVDSSGTTTWQAHDVWGGGYKSGWYRRCNHTGSTTNTMNMTSGLMYMVPMWITKACTVDRIALFSNGTGGATVRLGLYAHDADQMPSSLVLDAGTVTMDSVAFKEITISQSLDIGLYFAACAYQSGTTPNVTNTDSNTMSYGPGLFGATSLSTALLICYTETGITGAFPSTASASSTATTCPTMYVRFV